MAPPGCSSVGGMRRLTAVVAAMAFVVAACGDGDEGAGGGSFDSPEAIAEALGCSGSYEVPEEDEGDDMGFPDYGAVEGNCEHEGETMSLTTFPESGDADQAEKLVEGVGCSFGVAFGITQFHIVRGDNWFASIEDGDGGSQEREKLEPVADALGGEVRTIECEDP